MKTFNIRYRSSDRLKDFIYENQIVDSADILIQIFTYHKDENEVKEIISILTNLLPSSSIIGTSTDGEIIDGRVLTNNSIISITVFDKTSVSSTYIEDIDGKSFDSGVEIAKSIVSDDTKAVILFASSPYIDGSEFLDGVESVKSDVVIAGGLSGDGGRFDGGIVFDNDVITQNGIVGISLNGDSLYASSRYKSDWEPVGREFKVTKAKDCKIFTIDKIPVHKLYEKYLGEGISGKLPLSGVQFPFVLKDTESGKYIARSLRSNSDDESFEFSANISEGESVQIAFGDSDKMLKESQDLIIDVAENESIESLFIYASGGRRRFLKSVSFAEIESYNQLGTNSGFFGFGEFFSNKDESIFLNQSISILVLSEIDEVKKRDIHFKTTYKKIDSNLEVTKALANIAQVSSRELQELNQKLEQRVKDEVKKNRDKDSILIHNSKLAQMGEMMSMIAHQWRQPLSAISSTSTGLQVKIELGKYNEEFFLTALSKIEDYVKHLSDTIDDFADFFKPSKRKLLTTLDKMVEKALFILSSSFTKYSIEIQTNYKTDIEFKTYSNEIIQVLINLLKNAENVLLKREIKNPKIIIDTFVRDDKKYIEIVDNAGGIDETIIGEVFNSYFTTKESENSTGLGLYMSKFIIEDSCGGTLSVVNEREGAKFTIILD